jgi:hypothetical protein
MMRTLSVLIVVPIVALAACASSVPTVAAPSEPVADLRRLAVVSSGESKLTLPPVAGTKMDLGRVFNEVAKWYPKAAALAPLITAVQRGIDWLSEVGRPAAAASGGVSPGAVVADAFARTLLASGRFDQIPILEREPVGEDRRQIDALVRVTVPAWGVVRVRDGKPDLMAAYADARVQVVARPTGVVVWEHDEDVTHGERLPLQAFTGDGELTRQGLKDVLERAGQRLANEFLYARSGGR